MILDASLELTMSKRRHAIAALSILFLIAFAMLASVGYNLNLNWGKTHVSLLSGSNDPYSENLAVYSTSNEAYWSANLVGGNISLGSSFSLPAGVSAFTLVLTHYNSWSPSYETFTKYGLGLLGPNEPMPNATLLTIETTSPSAAGSLAISLSQMFALAFTLYTSNSTSFTYLSPMNFVTEMHVYFWKLIPASAGGFASIMSEATYETLDLNSYTLTDSAGSFSLSYGGLTPVTSTSFSLYDLLGVSSLNYSSASSSSGVQVHILGGVSTGVNSSFTNTLSNFSSYASASYTGGSNRVVPNLNASLDFSFPVIAAYRQITSPNSLVSPLALSPGQNVSVTITVNNVSPSGSPPANVTLNDDWIKTLYPTDFTIKPGENTTGSYANMTSGDMDTLAYAFTIGSNVSGLFALPPTPVTYSFVVANKTLTESTFLNSETLSVGVADEPELEATASVGVIQAAQALSLNVTVTNKGNGVASMLSNSNGGSLSSLPVGASWSYNITTSSPSLTSVNASLKSTVSWLNANSVMQSATTNGVNAIYGFANPGSPSTLLSKSISLAANHSALNVTLSVQNTGSNTVTNLTIADSVPPGMIFFKSLGNNTVFNSGSLVYSNSNLTSLAPGAIENFTYSLIVTSPIQNFVFMPANVSAPWNNATVVHFSQGMGLPLGVVATKLITPSYGFQGSNVTEHLSIENKGNLSIFDVALSNSSDSFISTVASTGSTVPILNTSQFTNSTIKGYYTASPGNYSTSAAAASFIFAGSNQTASTNTYTVTIYQSPSGTLYPNSAKIEENHPIDIVLKIENPSNVTISNIKYDLTLPSYLHLTSGPLSGTIPSIAPHQNATTSFVVETSLPDQYTIPAGSITFQFGGQTLKGVITSLTINIVDDITTRYAIPVVIGLVIVAATLVYVRRLSKPKATQ